MHRSSFRVIAFCQFVWGVDIVVGLEEGSDDRKQVGASLFVNGAELVLFLKRHSQTA
jgi:hypothetical protein